MLIHAVAGTDQVVFEVLWFRTTGQRSRKASAAGIVTGGLAKIRSHSVHLSGILCSLGPCFRQMRKPLRHRAWYLTTPLYRFTPVDTGLSIYTGLPFYTGLPARTGLYRFTDLHRFYRIAPIQRYNQSNFLFPVET